MFQTMQLWLGEVSKQTHNLLLHGEYVSNPPLPVERFHPLDGTLQDLNQSLLETRIDLVLFPSVDGRVFQLQLTILDKHLVHLVTAKLFHKFVAASGSSQTHANMQPLFASI